MSRSLCVSGRTCRSKRYSHRLRDRHFPRRTVDVRHGSRTGADDRSGTSEVPQLDRPRRIRDLAKGRANFLEAEPDLVGPLMKGLSNFVANCSKHIRRLATLDKVCTMSVPSDTPVGGSGVGQIRTHAARARAPSPPQPNRALTASTPDDSRRAPGDSRGGEALGFQRQ
jgi:hypothetical protein